MSYEHFAYGVLAENLGAELGSCPDFLAERLLKEAFIRFCHDSEAYRIPYRFITAEWQSRYPIDDLHEQYVLRADFVKADGRLLTPISRQEAVSKIAARPTNYYCDAECIVLSPVPSAKGLELDCEFIVVPTLKSSGIPTDLYNRYWYTIRHLLFFMVYTIPDADWTDANRAAFHHQQYLADLTRVKREAKKHDAPIMRKVRYGGL